MKIMNVSLSIDVSNEDHVKALDTFARALGGLPQQVGDGVSTPVVVVSLDEEEPEREKKAPAKRASRAKAPVKDVDPEPEEVETTDEEDNWLDEEETADDDVVVNHLLLRDLVSKRQAKHRPALREKFQEMGVANVSSIPEDKLKVFYKFLLTLED